MKPSLGYLEFDDIYDRWLIKKANYVIGTGFGGDYLELVIQKHKTKEKKTITIRSSVLIDNIITTMQREYPNSMHWKTLSQRRALRRNKRLRE